VPSPLDLLGGPLARPRLEPTDRALLAAVSRALPRGRWSCFFVKPETLLRWHRRLVAGAWTYPRRGQGRPPLDHGIQELIIRRAHQALQLQAPDPTAGLTIMDEGREGGVHRRDLLSGLLHEYWRAA
jgi:hypothetical protein